MDRSQRLADTERSWNVGTRAHNAHKRDQAPFLKAGGSTLFSEELELLGDVSGKRLLHTLCNSGQDTLSLVALGAKCVGVDLSEEAIRFARELSRQSGISARFHESEIQEFLEGPLEPESFDLVFGSYGCLPWIDDLSRFSRGIAERLAPGGRFVVLEFHPMAWSFDEHFQLRDPYFAPSRVFSAPVGDYVGKSDGVLAPSGYVPSDPPYENPHLAHAFQHTVADIVTATISAGLVIESVREWPYANGCRVCDALVPSAEDSRRFTTPRGVPSVPLMLGLTARRPAGR